MADELPHFLPYTAKLGAWLDRTFPRRADRVIAPHQRLAEYLIACGCDPARVFVVPPPLDVAAFEPGPLSESMPPVLYTGNLDAYQRLDFLMRAMMAVRKTLPAARLIVATPHKARMRDAEVVRTPDFDSVRRVLSQDAVVACPRVSWSGYPIKVLNAMAAGKAVVACEGAAPPIVHNENGILVRGDDEEAFAQALVRLLTRPELRSRLGNKARETIGANHAPERIAQAVEAIYGGLIGKDER
jgi:glycosyltransferase involved in cell wall biosynthesis